MRTKKIDLVEEQQKQEREKRMTYISTLADQQKVKEKMMRVSGQNMKIMKNMMM